MLIRITPPNVIDMNVLDELKHTSNPYPRFFFSTIRTEGEPGLSSLDNTFRMQGCINAVVCPLQFWVTEFSAFQKYEYVYSRQSLLSCITLGNHLQRAVTQGLQPQWTLL